MLYIQHWAMRRLFLSPQYNTHWSDVPINIIVFEWRS
ncbi:DUF4113 domain-containing protein [Shewanella baltica]|nr:DUF4113 domain-containing protein [Shewanella baltica]